ncbi:DnaJ domain-containing protein [Cynara cardunculus var. scolymus]|uniref:DnaJ domain-containing protein n=2 Tax=Cynara cardunculus var. scolymus TaxID=59895 RepID=A0A103Y791_CYNCS|nr:DnaJ domain-containing protein [Cynara cardunculus var. scolymus]
MTATIDNLHTLSQEETLYDLLGISESGTLFDIKRAYRQMALKYHPDVSPTEQVDEYTLRFIRVQEAYETLSDPYARAMYDASMVKGFHLGFSVNKGFQSDIKLEEKALWKKSWQMQVLELKQRSTMKKVRVDRGERVSWGEQVRKRRSESCDHGSTQDQ